MVSGDCSKLDLLLTTSPDNYVVSVSAQLGISDHSVVSTLAKQSPNSNHSKAGERKFWLYDKADWDGMRSFLADVEWSSLSKGHSADAAWSCVDDNLVDARHFYIIKDEPWFKEQCREAVEAKQKACTKWQKQVQRTPGLPTCKQTKLDCQRVLQRAHLQFSRYLEQERT
jgi:hypothetical protein